MKRRTKKRNGKPRCHHCDARLPIQCNCMVTKQVFPVRVWCKKCKKETVLPEFVRHTTEIGLK